MRSNSQLVMSYCWSISLKWLHQYIGWLHTFSERNGFSSSQSQLLSNAVTSEKGIALPTTINWCPRSGICYRCYLCSLGAWWLTHSSGAYHPVIVQSIVSFVASTHGYAVWKTTGLLRDTLLQLEWLGVKHSIASAQYLETWRLTYTGE